MEKNRSFSLALAGSASLLLGWAIGPEAGILARVLMVLVSALIHVPVIVMIWFSDEIGSYSGPSTDGPMVPTPGIIIRIFGWLVLVMLFFAACDTALHPEKLKDVRTGLSSIR